MRMRRMRMIIMGPLFMFHISVSLGNSERCYLKKKRKKKQLQKNKAGGGTVVF